MNGNPITSAAIICHLDKLSYFEQCCLLLVAHVHPLGYIVLGNFGTFPHIEYLLSYLTNLLYALELNF